MDKLILRSSWQTLKNWCGLPVNIPIEFDYNGQHIKGTFTSVSGAGGSNSMDLLIGGYYSGKLWLAEESRPGLPRDPNNILYKWRFSSQSGKFEELADYFGAFIDGERNPQLIEKAGSRSGPI